MCQKTYRHKRNLYKHMRFECGNKRPFSCPHCPYKASQKGTLKSHVVIKHKSLMFTYPSQAAPKKNVRSVKKHNCEETVKAKNFFLCADIPWLHDRRQLHPHVCDVCGRSYKYRDNLLRHKRQECLKEPKFACDFCSYKAKYRSSLRAHIVCKHSEMVKSSV
ncbi:zinc finger protein 782-like [Macrosteles quadrilineatus]|uniref:zinc finger protein 782-like n=1 Tax=Macrosteles quadrilineatus TaxID=74068 RepID=UPI0023E0AA34|nr:zinc finger protein 782-like [Macrosteles quadrilineatus]